MLDISSVVSVKEIDLDGARCLELVTFDEAYKDQISTRERGSAQTLDMIQKLVKDHLMRMSKYGGQGQAPFLHVW